MRTMLCAIAVLAGCLPLYADTALPSAQAYDAKAQNTKGSFYKPVPIEALKRVSSSIEAAMAGKPALTAESAAAIKAVVECSGADCPSMDSPSALTPIWTAREAALPLLSKLQMSSNVRTRQRATHALIPLAAVGMDIRPKPTTPTPLDKALIALTIRGTYDADKSVRAKSLLVLESLGRRCTESLPPEIAAALERAAQEDPEGSIRRSVADFLEQLRTGVFTGCY